MKSVLAIVALSWTASVWGAPATAPVAVDDSVTTNEDQVPVSFNVLPNDSDANADPIRVYAASATTNGSRSIFTNGNVTYTPNPGFSGDDSFLYQDIEDTAICDPAVLVGCLSNIATVSIRVLAVADAPVVSATDISASEDAPISLNLSAALSGQDADGSETLEVQILGVTTGAVLSAGTDLGAGVWQVPLGSLAGLVLTLPPATNGTLSLTLRAVVTDVARDASNAIINTDVATVDRPFTVTVAPVNDPPVVNTVLADVVTDEDSGSFTVDLSAAFADVDVATNGDSLTLSAVSSNSTLFSAVAVSGTTLTLTPAADQNGLATITVEARDASNATATTSFGVAVNPVNDAPVVAQPIGTQSVGEDSPDIVINLSAVFDDVDIATNGDVLTFAIQSVSNGGLFDAQSVVGTTLTLSLAAEQSGTAVVVVRAADSAGASVLETFTVDVAPVADPPIAAPDTAAMNEDEPGITIAVLANDVSSDGALTIVSAGITVTINNVDYPNSSASVPTTVLNALGDAVQLPNGTVTISGAAIIYEPKENFFGTDSFEYTVADPEGDTATATVTITVAAQNDAPTGIQERSFTMLENSVLILDATEGVLQGAYDVDGALIGPDGEPVGSSIEAVISSVPVNGAVTFDGVSGALEYTPTVNFTGTDTFTYRLFDSLAFSTGAVYVVRIVVTPLPPPVPPPPAGQVVTQYNLSDTPLEELATVPANVLVVMDDSGSMDWQLTIESSADGGFPISNAAIATKAVRSESFVYLFDLPTNTYPPSSASGHLVPSEEALAAAMPGNQYGAWRTRNAQYNRIYYDPTIAYTPWVGLDNTNQEFANANPVAVRLDPVDPSRTIDLTVPVSFTAQGVPEWRTNGGTTNVNMVDFYLPAYYATTASPPLAHDHPFTLVEIKPGVGPLAGGLFPGGRNRSDCAVGDGNPSTCTHAQELQNFANWFAYYRSREYVTKNGIGSTVASVQDIRVGYDTVSNTTSMPIRAMNESFREGNKKALVENIYKVDSFGGTPLRQVLDRAGLTFSCQTGSDCPALPPPEGMCQRNFALVFSDGYWSGGSGVPDNTDEDGPGPFDGGRYADGVDSTLADVAMHWYETDLFPAVEDRVPVSARDVQGAPAGTFDAPTELMHQHMKTYAIGFGLKGTVDPLTIPTDPSVPFVWPDPFSGSLEKIDDLVHAAVDGRGAFVNATNPIEVRAAFEAAFREFMHGASSVSSAAFNSTSLQEDTILFRGFFDLRDNTGDLRATEVLADGSLAVTPLWSAAAQLDGIPPDQRKIVTFNPTTAAGAPFRHTLLSASQQLTITPEELGFLRGERTNEQPTGTLRARNATAGLLGDIVNSSPVFVGAPRAIQRDQEPFPTTDPYSNFVTAKSSRTPVVYVGANDGIMHGFNASTGDEVFGYVPSTIIDDEKIYHNDLKDFTSSFYFHQYYVDLSPRLNDVYMRPNRSAVNKSWNTVLVGGLGGGGKGYFALNVTDPASSYVSEVEAANVVLWEFTEADDTYPVDALGDPLGGAVGAWIDPSGNPVKDLGYALTAPTIAMSNVDDTGTPTQKEWMAIFGNGYDSTAGIAKLFVLFMDRGLDGWTSGDFVKLDTQVGVPGPGEQRAGFPNALGTPAVVDRDLNGTADLAYAGDLLGNMYRFDISAPDSADWTVTRIFTATYFNGTTDVRQPITVQPMVIKHPTEVGFMVIFGTGSFVTHDDATSEEIQSIYGIWDRGDASPPTAAADTKSLRLVEQTVTNVVQEVDAAAITRRAISSVAVNYTPETISPGVYGWFIDMDMPRATTTIDGDPNPDTSGNAPPDPQFPGERAIRRLIFRDGVIITTTVLPSTGAASCLGTSPGAIMLIDALTGGNPRFPVVDFNNDGEVDAGDLVDVGGTGYAAGLLFSQGDLDGTLVDLSTLGGEGDSDFLFVSGGDETTTLRIVDINDSRTGRLSWRELQQ